MHHILLIGGDRDGEQVTVNDPIPILVMPRKTTELGDSLDGLTELRYKDSIPTRDDIYRLYQLIDFDGTKINVYIHQDFWKSGRILHHILANYKRPESAIEELINAKR